MLERSYGAFKFYFGSAADAIYQEQYLGHPSNIFFSTSHAIRQLIHRWQLQHLFFGLQVHGAAGLQVTPHVAMNYQSFVYESDYLTTNVTAIGLGVMTADCLPIIICDPEHMVAVVIHAGWRGAVAGIVQDAVQHMCSTYLTKRGAIRAFFGPSAGVCCYQVGHEFLTIGKQNPYVHDALVLRKQDLFFNLALFAKHQLMTAGILETAIDDMDNLCTICDVRFYSYRRQGAMAGRQMTVVAIC